VFVLGSQGVRKVGVVVQQHCVEVAVRGLELWLVSSCRRERLHLDAAYFPHSPVLAG